jgi:hypothetical protein
LTEGGKTRPRSKLKGETLPLAKEKEEEKGEGKKRA